jgi:hypothetical protein
MRPPLDIISWRRRVRRPTPPKETGPDVHAVPHCFSPSPLILPLLLVYLCGFCRHSDITPLTLCLPPNIGQRIAFTAEITAHCSAMFLWLIYCSHPSYRARNVEPTCQPCASHRLHSTVYIISFRGLNRPARSAGSDDPSKLQSSHQPESSWRAW